MNRRELLKTVRNALAAGLATSLSESAEAQISTEDLEKQKRTAIESLTHDFPNNPELASLRSYIPRLHEESQMYIPDDQETMYVKQRAGARLQRFEKRVPRGAYGLFIFADVDKSGRPLQRLFVVRHENKGLTIVKAYRVSTSRFGFGIEPNSLKTPYDDDLVVADSKSGMLGEVLSPRTDDKRLTNIRVGNSTRSFVKGLSEEPGNSNPEIITDRYHLVGPKTAASRAIYVHSGNHSGKVVDGVWQTSLGGREGSSGCIRMSIVDARDLRLSGYVGRGTRVDIFATPEARAASRDSAPPRWVDRPEENVMPKKPTKQKSRRDNIQKEKLTAPPRWPGL